MASFTIQVSFKEEQMEELKAYIRECIENLKEEMEEKYAINSKAETNQT